MRKKLLTVPFALLLLCAISLLLMPACSRQKTKGEKDPAQASQNISDSGKVDSVTGAKENTGQNQSGVNTTVKNKEQTTILIYNFHVTNRCPSCIAIEEATTKTLETYFSEEVKQGRIKRLIINVDDAANESIAQKYEAFGSGLFVTCVNKGIEETTDLTGEGFKYARKKEEKFIELLKNQITTYLK